MTTITLDRDLQRAMRDYVTAANRVQNAEERADVGRISELALEQRTAAQAIAQALIQRGWRPPAPRLHGVEVVLD